MGTFSDAPFIIGQDGKSSPVVRLPRAHAEFDEAFLQELLVTNPEILPLQSFRDDVGQLLCLGREVQCGDGGAIDNLYLSTGGYPIVIETKLWRNPQARREVLSQVLDYVKDLTIKDFEWFNARWNEFSAGRYGARIALMEKLNELEDDELDEAQYVDRVNRACRRGDILSLIVGDGIETRLEELVSHLCKESAHLRYSLGLVELGCYKFQGPKNQKDLLVIPRLVQSVEPVQRAYVRIELEPELESKLLVTSVADTEEGPKGKYKRTTLTADELWAGIDRARGVEVRKRMEEFSQQLVDDLELDAEFRSAALMLKIPDPAGERPGASVLAIEREGRVYNPVFLRNQLVRMGMAMESANEISHAYWEALHQIDDRFGVDGMTMKIPKLFLPCDEILRNLDAIGKEIEMVTTRVREYFEGEDMNPASL